MDSPAPTILRIESLAYGRAAVGRYNGKVVFVEGAAPGDHAQVRLVRDHGAWFEAELVDVLEPGASRVTPPCPIADRCGGCCWQHVDYDEQLRAKRRAVIDAFERIGGIASPPVRAVKASPRTLEYRNRLKLRFEDGRLGFYRARTHSLVPIGDCLIAEDRVRQSLPLVERFVASLSTRVMRVEIASRGELAGVVVAVNSAGRLRRTDVHRVRCFLEEAGNPVRGVSMWGRGWRRHWGDGRRRITIDDALSIESGVAGFGQVNTEANRLLVSAVLAAAAPGPSDALLDLYAGAGNFSLPLAGRCRRVIAVEADHEAVEAARASADYQNISNVEFHAARVESFLTHQRRPAPDIIIANPPRDGLGDAARLVADLRAPRIIYVSCNPTTLARDSKLIVDSGYQLHSIAPIDLFPQTFHVETVCDMRLT